MRIQDILAVKDADTLRRLAAVRTTAADKVASLKAARDRATRDVQAAETARTAARAARKKAEDAQAADYVSGGNGDSKAARKAAEDAAEADGRAKAAEVAARAAQAALDRLPAALAEAEAEVWTADARLARAWQTEAEGMAGTIFARIRERVDGLGDDLALLHAVDRLCRDAGAKEITGLAWLDRHWRSEGLAIYEPGDGVKAPRWLGRHAGQWPMRAEAAGLVLDALRAASGLPDWSPPRRILAPQEPAAPDAPVSAPPKFGVQVRVTPGNRSPAEEVSRPKVPPKVVKALS